MTFDRLRALPGCVSALLLAMVAPAQAQITPEDVVEFSLSLAEMQGGMLSWEGKTEDGSDIVLTGVVLEIPTEIGNSRVGAEEIRLVASGDGDVAMIVPHAVTLAADLPKGRFFDARITLENPEFLFGQDGVMTLDSGFSGLSVNTVVRSASGEVVATHDIDLADGTAESVLDIGPGDEFSIAASWNFRSQSGSYSSDREESGHYQHDDVRGALELSMPDSGDEATLFDLVVDNLAISTSGTRLELFTTAGGDISPVVVETGPGSLELRAGADPMAVEFAVGPVAVTAPRADSGSVGGSIDHIRLSMASVDDPPPGMDGARVVFSMGDIGLSNVANPDLDLVFFLLNGPDGMDFDMKAIWPEDWTDRENGDAEDELPSGTVEVTINSFEIETSLFTVSAEGDFRATRDSTGLSFPVANMSVRMTGLVTLLELLTSAETEGSFPGDGDVSGTLVPALTMLRLFGREGEDGSLNFEIEADGERIKVNGVKF